MHSTTTENPAKVTNYQWVHQLMKTLAVCRITQYCFYSQKAKPLSKLGWLFFLFLYSLLISFRHWIQMRPLPQNIGFGTLRNSQGGWWHERGPKTMPLLVHWVYFVLLWSLCYYAEDQHCTCIKGEREMLGLHRLYALSNFLFGVPSGQNKLYRLYPKVFIKE